MCPGHCGLLKFIALMLCYFLFSNKWLSIKDGKRIQTGGAGWQKQAIMSSYKFPHSPTLMTFFVLFLTFRNRRMFGGEEEVQENRRKGGGFHVMLHGIFRLKHAKMFSCYFVSDNASLHSNWTNRCFAHIIDILSICLVADF